MIIVLILFWSIGLFLSIKSPTYFVLYFLLASTKYLGFIDPSTFIVNDVELGYFGLNIVTLIGSFMFTKWYQVPKNALFFIFLILAMLVYGVFKPIFDGNSTLFQSLMASKEIWFYFLFFYLVVHRKKINNHFLIIFIKYTGVYLSLIYIAGTFASIIISPYYFEDEIVRVYYPTYISLALLFFAVDIKSYKLKKIKHVLPILLLLGGLVKAGYISLTIMSIIGFIVYVYVFDQKLQLKTRSIIVLSVLSVLIIFLIFLIKEETYKLIESGIYDIISGNNPSLSSRAYYNEFRWEMIDKQKEFGYGFIHQSSEVMSMMNTNEASRYMQRLSVIDSGYVDMLTKFGFIGTAIILLVYLKYIVNGFMRINKNPLNLAMAIYLTQYFFVNYTWSVFTYAFGIIPGVVGLYLLLGYKPNKSKRTLVL